MKPLDSWYWKHTRIAVIGDRYVWDQPDLWTTAALTPGEPTYEALREEFSQ